MPLSDTIIILVGSLAIGTSIFAVYLVQKFRKEMSDEEKFYDDAKAREVKETYDFLSKKEKVEEMSETQSVSEHAQKSSISDKPKKTLGEVKLRV